MVLNILKSHRSVRNYKSTPISDQEFYELLNAAQYAASSNFVQAYSVIQIKDREKINKLGELSSNQQQFKTAALSLVFCADLNRARHAVLRHGEEIKGGTLENFLVAAIDTALLAQNFVIAAESKGYGICFIGGVRNNPREISDLLSLPDHVIPLFGLTVGVPDEQNEVKPRLPVKAIVHTDDYDETKYEQILTEYDEVISNYYKKRTTNSKETTWSQVMTDFLSDKRRPFLKDFVLSKGYLQEEK